MTEEYKTYVWEDVLIDYTPGLIVVKAKTKGDAWQRLKEKDETAYSLVSGKSRRPRTEPRELEDGELVHVWGGG